MTCVVARIIGVTYYETLSWMTAGWIMSRHVLIGVLLLIGGTAAADPAAIDRVLRLADSHWEIYRPDTCELRIFDLGYLTDGLRAAKPGFGLRFRSTRALTIDLRFDPITDPGDIFGPVYDSHIGATVLTFAVEF